MSTRTVWNAAAVAAIALLGALPPVSLAAEATLLDFGRGFDPTAVEARDAQVSLAAGTEGGVLRVATGHNTQWPGITLKAPQGRWDLSAFEYVAVDLKNVGPHPVEIGLRLDSPGLNAQRHFFQEQTALEPGEKETFQVTLRRKIPAELAGKLFGMRGYPGGLAEQQGIDTGNVDQLMVFVPRPTADQVFEIDNVRAGGSAGLSEDFLADPDRLFPMIDAFGQFIHKDWPRKTGSPVDLANRQEEEAADLATHPGPKDWNQYGGWTAGPRLEATGFFRAEKYRGKWWLVDPEGRLFWSHGIDCIRADGYTPITNRKHWYRNLPQPGSPLAEFYGRAGWAPHGYYQGKTYETYNFTAANLLRKYGANWQPRYAEISHRRLRSWGMNTVGNWSAEQVYLLRKTPYVVAIHAEQRPLEGSTGYWKKFPDVFDPGFKEALRRRLSQEKGKSAGDPWCIGYFVDNELSWGDELSLAVATLASPAEQPAKRVLVDDLKAAYGTIEKLNGAWDTAHASWDALLDSTAEPDRKKAYDDLARFYTKTADGYFESCREAVKEVAPENLYLGCRFAWVNDRAVRAAAKHCDVIGFNKYRYSVADFSLPPGIDKPAIIGEFHFGALDRGMFHPGLRKVADQAERAEAYTSYVRGALENPWLVGTHWFQYGDQATTGRGDGENYQIGFLDVCDTPYVETIEACREVGETMYRLRLGDR